MCRTKYYKNEVQIKPCFKEDKTTFNLWHQTSSYRRFICELVRLKLAFCLIIGDINSILVNVFTVKLETNKVLEKKQRWIVF